MVDNKKLKDYNLKTFLYNFFITWNFLIIILLIWLNFYITPKQIIKPKKIKETPQMKGQFKFLWQSRREFQDIDNDIFYIDCIESNNDKILDFITISQSGYLTVLDGENGHILFKKNVGPIKAMFMFNRENIITGNMNGKLSAISVGGKLLWEMNINEKIFDICLKAVQTEQAFHLMNFKTKRIEKSFRYIKNDILGQTIYGKFNADDKPDYLIYEKKYIRCLDGITLKQLWEKEIPYIFSGKKNIIYDKNKDLFILLPLYNGIIKVINKYGADVFEIKLKENLISQPYVFKNKNYIFIQQTINNNLYAFDFEKRKNIWSLDFTEKIIDVRSMDINYDNINEIFVLTERGKIYILNSKNGKILDYYSSLPASGDEKVVSNLVISDIDNDNNYELGFSTDKANVYIYKYVLFNKKFVFKKFFKTLKSKWKLTK